MCKFSDLTVSGIITNEAGGIATVNGWLQAAMLGVPVVDLPSNGRAHPTGIMGAMGLQNESNYQSIQAAIGGNPATGCHIETVIKGTINTASSQIRNASVLAGGFVAVARNPVTVAYAKKNGAPGAVKMAIELGKKMQENKTKGGDAVINAVCEMLGGKIVHSGVIENVELVCKGGFDVGVVSWNDFELRFWNEYMTAENNGERLGTFPDLLMTLDAKTGWPITSADIAKGQDVAVLHVPQKNICLGAGMRDSKLFEACEQAVGKEIISYVF